MFHYTSTEYNTFPVWEGLCPGYRLRELVPTVSIVPELVNCAKGLVLSSRSGPPVIYQIIQTTQKIANIFINVFMMVIV